MEPLIRPLRDSEREELTLLFHKIWHETQAPIQDVRMARHRDVSFFRKRVVDRASRTLVSESDGRISGFAVWTAGMLNSLFVDVKARGSGLGHALCLRAEAEMVRCGAPVFELDCVVGNYRGRSFYERQGWSVSGELLTENVTAEGVCHVSVWRMTKASGIGIR